MSSTKSLHLSIEERLEEREEAVCVRRGEASTQERGPSWHSTS